MSSGEDEAVPLMACGHGHNMVAGVSAGVGIQGT